MENKILTAEETLLKNIDWVFACEHEKQKFITTMIEFTTLHVMQALTEASKESWNSEKILECYPLTNIK